MKNLIPRVLLLLAVAAPFTGGCVKVHMPGKSFSGALPPLSPDESELSGRLAAHVRTLGGDIGERNVYHAEKLEQAAQYCEHQFRNLGFIPGVQEYQAGGQTVRNIDATQPGTTKSDEIVV